MPNPNGAYFNCAFPLAENQTALLEVYDLLGRVASSQTTMSSVTRVDAGSFAAGTYFVKLKVNGTLVGVAKWVKVQ